MTNFEKLALDPQTVAMLKQLAKPTAIGAGLGALGGGAASLLEKNDDTEDPHSTRAGRLAKSMAMGATLGGAGGAGFGAFKTLAPGAASSLGIPGTSPANIADNSSTLGTAGRFAAAMRPHSTMGNLAMGGAVATLPSLKNGIGSLLNKTKVTKGPPELGAWRSEKGVSPIFEGANYSKNITPAFDAVISKLKDSGGKAEGIAKNFANELETAGRGEGQRQLSVASQNAKQNSQRGLYSLITGQTGKLNREGFENLLRGTQQHTPQEFRALLDVTPAEKANIPLSEMLKAFKHNTLGLGKPGAGPANSTPGFGVNGATDPLRVNLFDHSGLNTAQRIQNRLLRGRASNGLEGVYSPLGAGGKARLEGRVTPGALHGRTAGPALGLATILGNETLGRYYENSVKNDDINRALGPDNIPAYNRATAPQ